MANTDLFKPSIDTTTLAKRLAQAETGKIIPYSELNDLIGRNVQHEARGVLLSARSTVQRDHRIVFGVVAGVGLRRLADAEVAETGKNALHHIHRTSIRGAKRLSCIEDFDAMPPDKRIAHNASMSILGAIAVATQPKKLLKVEQKVKEAGAELPLAKTLELFR